MRTDKYIRMATNFITKSKQKTDINYFRKRLEIIMGIDISFISDEEIYRWTEEKRNLIITNKFNNWIKENWYL
jgi:hypothetical protein